MTGSLCRSSIRAMMYRRRERKSRYVLAILYSVVEGSGTRRVHWDRCIVASFRHSYRDRVTIHTDVDVRISCSTGHRHLQLVVLPSATRHPRNWFLIASLLFHFRQWSVSSSRSPLPHWVDTGVAHTACDVYLSTRHERMGLGSPALRIECTSCDIEAWSRRDPDQGTSDL